MQTLLSGANVPTTRPGRAAQMATRAAFFVAGFGMAAWAPLIPLVKMRLGINDAELGLLLLSLGSGSLLSMPLTGILASRLGCRIVILLSAALLCLSLPALTLADSVALMVPVLLLFGAAIGTLDVSMNIQAVVVEQASGRAMMSGFHGFFSIGGIAGAGGISALLWLGLSPLTSTLIVAALIVVLLLLIQRHLLSAAGESDAGPLLVMPRGWVMFIGLLCFIMFLAEGAVLDWGALFLTAQRGLTSAQAGIGYAAFSVAMTLGRLTGDRLIDRLGRYAVMMSGSLCAALGLAVAISFSSAVMSVIGFLMIGLGASNVVPILFNAAGNQKAMPASLAIASITTVGYAGILVGPTLLGLIAQAASLSVAFGCVAALLLIVTASARAITR
ncbi:MFS transporter [Affinibrenneria salicis]|uniref:MFS transporter n=1 Tax=Affinibrenneria salicis TaxID=2590031 RepID=A0A5J5G0G1_9GAMM|nr:MFS transporter [Affinibrenneria salicis]KAA9000009.1 MFS transporter [Affinibrenneria salicis]